MTTTQVAQLHKEALDRAAQPQPADAKLLAKLMETVERGGSLLPLADDIRAWSAARR